MSMCGIAGIVSGRGWRSQDSLRRNVEDMLNAQTSRGPDGRGVFVSETTGIALGNVRLAIIDPGADANQPLASVNGPLHIAYNGEIYNYRRLRSELEERGVQLRTHSDTEVILELYRLDGPPMLSRLRGMFAFAILDERCGEAFLARDPFGIKPLFYSDGATGFAFASQVKALIAGGASRELDPAGRAGFFLWGSVPEPHTMFEAIKALPAGTWLRVSSAEGEVVGPRTWFNLVEAVSSHGVDSGELHGSLGDVLASSVEAHLESDVDVGLFLSAGIDSAAIAFHSTQVSRQPPKCFTLGFEELRGTQYDEVDLASQLARSAGLSHSVGWINQAEFESVLDHLLGSMDQPSIDGVNTYFVARLAAMSGIKVALSGIGGDELFGGYPGFGRVPRAVGLTSWVPARQNVGRYMRRLSTPVLPRNLSSKWAGILEYGGSWTGAYLLERGLFMPWDLGSVMDPESAADGLRTLEAEWQELEATLLSIDAAFRVSVLELAGYMRNQLLRDADWAGMAHSVEIRVPLLDMEVLSHVASATASGRGPTKRDVALSTVRPMPSWLISRSKTGFSTPIAAWAQLLLGIDPTMRSWATYLDQQYTAGL